MSNRTIIENLEAELGQYKSGRFTRNEIGRRFLDHIEALEGIPYSIVTEAHHIKAGLECDGFSYDENESEAESADLHRKIGIWLEQLKKEIWQ